MSKARISYTHYLPETKRPTYHPNTGALKIVIDGSTSSVMKFNAYGEGKYQCQRQNEASCEIKFDDFTWKGKMSDLKEILKNQLETKLNDI